MDYTRVTVHGSHLRGDVVLPNDELLMDLMPTLLDLMEEPKVQPGSMRLTTVEGQQLEPEKRLADQPIEDGSLLFITSVDEAPRPPELTDVTEAVLAERSRRDDVWNLVWARRLSAVTGAIAGFVAAATMFGAHRTVVGICAAVAVLTLAIIARRTTRWPLTGAISMAAGAAVAWGVGFAPRIATTSTHSVVVAVLGAVTAAGVVMLAIGWGTRRQPMLLGGVAALVTGGAPLLASYWHRGDHSIFAVEAVLITLALGLIPSMAMSMSGLTGLDDQIVDGRRVNRAAAAERTRDMFAALGWLVVAVAAPLAASLWVLSTYPSIWAKCLTVAVGITVACRARFLPLVEQVTAVWVVEVALTYWLVTTWVSDPTWRALAMIGAATLVMLLLIGNPTSHVRARIRGVLNLIEQLTVLAMVPLLLGYFGVFSDLLKTYHR